MPESVQHAPSGEKAFIRGAPQRPGRPTSLTPEVHQKVVHAVQLGMYIEQAAALAGVNRTTLYGWMKRGGREAYGPYYQFYCDMQKALAQCEYMALARLQKLSAEGSFAATSWFLERRFHARWSRPQKVEVAGKVEGGVSVEIIRAAAAMADEKRTAQDSAKVKKAVAVPDSGPGLPPP